MEIIIFCLCILNEEIIRHYYGIYNSSTNPLLIIVVNWKKKVEYVFPNRTLQIFLNRYCQGCQGEIRDHHVSIY